MRVTVAPRCRVSTALPWCTSMEEAKARAVAVQELVNRLRVAGQTDFVASLVESAATADADKLAALARAVDGLVGGTLVKATASGARPVVTFRAFAERWTSGRLHTEFPDHVKLKQSEDDVSRLAKWIYPVVGDKPITEFTLDDALYVLRQLPRTMAPATRRHVAQLMVRLMNLAVYPCRVIATSPLPRGFLPKIGPAKAKAWAYPEEDGLLLACPAVPLVNRILYAFAHREGMRQDELVRLTWGDIDRVRGTVRLDENKTDDPRTWMLGRDVFDALRTWWAMQGAPMEREPVFEGLKDVGHLAHDYRLHLQQAGVNRPELFESTNARRQLRFHDTRATFITVALATGKTETWVSDRTGHKSSSQIHGYRRAARSAQELGVTWFSSMVAAVPELAAASAAVDAAAESNRGPSAATASH